MYIACYTHFVRLSGRPAGGSSPCPICLSEIEAGEVFTVDCKEQHLFCVTCLHRHCSVQVHSAFRLCLDHLTTLGLCKEQCPPAVRFEGSAVPSERDDATLQGDRPKVRFSSPLAKGARRESTYVLAPVLLCHWLANLVAVVFLSISALLALAFPVLLVVTPCLRPTSCWMRGSSQPARCLARATTSSAKKKSNG